VKGKVKEQWGKLTDDDLEVIGGRRDQLEGKIQERYGYAKDQVRRAASACVSVVLQRRPRDMSTEVCLAGLRRLNAGTERAPT
jgi:uncharacterized protein YjbJ (UPF0337 family)